MDKLVVLNDALTATGNNPLNVLNDGTAEWVVADRAFDRAVRDLTSRHGWPFAQVNHELVVSGNTPSLVYEFAFELPTEVVHVKRVLVRGFPTLSYEIVGNTVCLDHDSGVAIEGYAMPANAIWHPQAAEILTLYVEAGCLAGLNEDFAEARNRKMEAEGRLMEARPRVDRQNPAKNAYLSSIAAARRSRLGERPRSGEYPLGGGFGDTGAAPDGSVLLDD